MTAPSEEISSPIAAFGCGQKAGSAVERVVHSAWGGGGEASGYCDVQGHLVVAAADQHVHNGCDVPPRSASPDQPAAHGDGDAPEAGCHRRWSRRSHAAELARPGATPIRTSPSCGRPSASRWRAATVRVIPNPQGPDDTLDARRAYGRGAIVRYAVAPMRAVTTSTDRAACRRRSDNQTARALAEARAQGILVITEASMVSLAVGASANRAPIATRTARVGRRLAGKSGVRLLSVTSSGLARRNARCRSGRCRDTR